MKLSIVDSEPDAHSFAMAWVVGKRAFDLKRVAFLEVSSVKYTARPTALGATVVVVRAEVILSGATGFINRLVYSNRTLTPVTPNFLPDVPIAYSGVGFGGTLSVGATSAGVFGQGKLLFDKGGASIPMDSGVTNEFGGILGISRTGDKFCVIYSVRRKSDTATVPLPAVGTLSQTTLPYLAVAHYKKNLSTAVWEQSGDTYYAAVPIPPSQFANELTARGRALYLTQLPGAVISFNTDGSKACGILQLRVAYGVAGTRNSNALSNLTYSVRWVEVTTHSINLSTTTDNSGITTDAITFGASEGYSVDIVESGGNVNAGFYGSGESRLLNSFWTSVYVVL